jgi:beta-barrel assembly-enhancing protease
MSAGERFEGWLADGRQATRRQVDIAFAEDGLVLGAPDRLDIERWPYAGITLIHDEIRHGPVRVAYGDARLEIGDPRFAAALHEAMPELHRARRRLVRRAVVGSCLFAGVVAGLWWGMPLIAADLVPFIPPRWETKLGNQVARLPIAGTTCDNPAGKAALAALTGRLLDGVDVPFTPKVTVRASSTVNAFAFPGAKIVVLNGLLQQAQSPDEVAGVLAHELTHGIKRHSMRMLIANAGLSLLFELTVGGGTGASVAFFLTTLSYSRDVEAEADEGATQLLRRAAIDTDGFAAFFERLEKTHGSGLPAFLNSHPATQQRAAKARVAPSGPTRPALTPEQWQALKAICLDQKK